MFNIQHSTLNIQHSTLNIQHSTLNIHHSHFPVKIILIILISFGNNS